MLCWQMNYTQSLWNQKLRAEIQAYIRDDSASKKDVCGK